MARDTINQLGKTLGKSARQLQQVRDRIGEEFPIIERARDTVSDIAPFSVDFVTTRAHQQVSIDIDIYRAPLTDASLKVGAGLRIDPDGTVNQTGDSGTYTDPNAINEQPGTTPVIISDGGTNPPPNEINSQWLTSDDFIYSTSAFPGNIYKIQESRMITMVGFYAESNPTFYVGLRKSDDSGLTITGVNDADYAGDEENRFWNYGVKQGTYTDTRPGWHVITTSGFTVLKGETAVFQFTNPTHDPTVYHYGSIENFSFMSYTGQNRYQWTASGIATDTLGVDSDGTHGIQPSYTGKPIPPYAMFVAYQGTPPRGFTQIEEVATPVFRDLHSSANPQPIVSVGPGDPRYLEGTREFKTLFSYNPGTLKVWVNGLRQVANYSYTTAYENYFTLDDDYPNIDLSWERVIVSYEVAGPVVY
jgi:hypothetical protein